MKSLKRGERRRQRQKKVQKVAKRGWIKLWLVSPDAQPRDNRSPQYTAYLNARKATAPQRYADNPQVCSNHCCGNQRRWYGESRREQRSTMSFKEAVIDLQNPELESCPNPGCHSNFCKACDW